MTQKQINESPTSPIIYQSKEMQKVVDKIDMLKREERAVLIIGESGTGKELVAKKLYKDSFRANKKFDTITCTKFKNSEMTYSELFGHVKGAYTGAISDIEGVFNLNDQGTLFLDELDSLDINIQGMILRVVEDGIIKKLGDNKESKTDVRLIAACQPGLENKIEEGIFREDLFYRLSTFIIELPPLREREGDVGHLLLHFLRQELKDDKVELKDFLQDDLVKDLLGYSWPGNVRQLESEVANLGIQIRDITDNKIRKLKVTEKKKIKLSKKITIYYDAVKDLNEFVDLNDLHNFSLVDLYSKFQWEGPRTFRRIYDRWWSIVKKSEGGLCRLMYELFSIKGKGKPVDQGMMRVALRVTNNHFREKEKEIIEEVIRMSASSKKEDLAIIIEQNILSSAFMLVSPKEIEEIFRDNMGFEFDNPKHTKSLISNINDLLNIDDIDLNEPIQEVFNNWKYNLDFLVKIIRDPDLEKYSESFKDTRKNLSQINTKLIKLVNENYPGKFDEYLYTV